MYVEASVSLNERPGSLKNVESVASRMKWPHTACCVMTLHSIAGGYQ